MYLLRGRILAYKRLVYVYIPVFLFAQISNPMYAGGVGDGLEVIMSKFFSYEERLELQKYLKKGLSFKEISRRLDKGPTTISREVRKYSSVITTGYPGQTHNTCKNRKP